MVSSQRRVQVLGLRAGDRARNWPVYYSYRGKGDRQRRREFPEPCFSAVVAALKARGREVAAMGPQEPLLDVSAHGFYLNLRRYLRKAGLPQAGVHLLRHSAAELRRDVGESIESVSRFLDHSNPAVTTT